MVTHFGNRFHNVYVSDMDQIFFSDVNYGTTVMPPTVYSLCHSFCTVDEYDGSQYLFKTSSEALDAICKDLVSVKHLWKPIGVLLGVKYTAFLQQRKDGKDQENLRQTIRQWLDTSKMLTLQRLVEAVEHSAGGNNYSLARQIKDKYTATTGWRCSV